MSERFPFDALAEAMRMTPAAAAWHLGISGATEHKRYREGGLSRVVADRLAVKAGFHPASVWPEWMESSIEDVRARKREANRRWRAKPEVRARLAAKRRAYYREVREYELARQRRYDEANRERIRERHRQRRRSAA